jgi:hypothetical protein
MVEKERAAAAEPSDCMFVLITAALPTAGKATMAQSLRQSEGVKSFALLGW